MNSPASHVPKQVAYHAPQPGQAASHVPKREPHAIQVFELYTQASVEQNIHLKRFSHLDPKTLASLLNDVDFGDNVILDIKTI